MKLLTWAMAAALLVPSLAAANPMRGHGRGERRAKMLERFDANRDGHLDDQERGAMMAAKAQRRAQMKQRFDANRDGQLDRREKQQARTAMRGERMQRRAERFQRMIERFDRDGDGNLGPGEVPPMAMRKMQRLDRDGDGWVRPHEMRMQPLPHEMRSRRDRKRGFDHPNHDAYDDEPPSQAPGAYDDAGDE